MKQPIVIVQGLQYGSEAKGAIAGYLCQKRNIDFAVRTGATNAGHTVYVHQSTAGGQLQQWIPVKLQQLPVGFVNPDTRLVLGAGALIDPAILERECDLLSELTGTNIRDRLLIDRRAGLHLSVHALRSAQSGRHHAMGATGKGCSEALIDRIRGRGEDHHPLFGETSFADGYDVCDTEALLNHAHDGGASILLEGTQGQLLDLYLGPYPYTTHKQTGPAQWMLEAGLSPRLPTEVVGVVRTFPIRVAGNSGPLPGEISWPILAREINDTRFSKGMTAIVLESSIQAFEEALMLAAKDFDLRPIEGLTQHEWPDAFRLKHKEAASELNTVAWKMLPKPVAEDLSKLFELTTVTKKLRRIARCDAGDLTVASRQARPDWIALTFANYLQSDWWYEIPNTNDGRWTAKANTVLVANVCKAPVKLATFGPAPSHILEQG